MSFTLIEKIANFLNRKTSFTSEPGGYVTYDIDGNEHILGISQNQKNKIFVDVRYSYSENRKMKMKSFMCFEHFENWFYKKYRKIKYIWLSNGYY